MTTRLPLVLALALSVALPAAAQDWPRDRTTITLGFGPGSGVDLLARVVTEALAARHPGKVFLVENKPGAGGSTSVETVVRGPTDGTLIAGVVSAPIIMNPVMMKVSYDPWKDLRPVTIIGATPSVLLVSKKLGVKTVAEFVALLKKEPGKYPYSSMGAGTTSHMSMELAASLAGSSMLHVPFRSTPEALQALITGDVAASTIPIGIAAEHMEAGTVVPLALTSAKRWPTFPDLPTTGEVGMKDIPVDSYVALFVSAATPKPIVDAIHADIKAIVAVPAVAEKIGRIYYRPVANTPEEYAAALVIERNQWEPLIHKLGLARKE